MTSSPLAGAGCERIGFDHFVASVPALRARREDRLADELEAASRHFCRALVQHRRSPAYRVRLRPPFALGVERLGVALLGAADVLRQGTEDEAALGSWCCALAARLQAVAHEPDIRVSRLLVFVNIDPRGLGELLIASVSDEEIERYPGLTRPSQR